MSDKKDRVKAGDRVAPFEPYVHTEASAKAYNEKAAAKEAALAKKAEPKAAKKSARKKART